MSKSVKKILDHIEATQNKEKYTPSPVALLLRDTFADEIRDFIQIGKDETKSPEERFAAQKEASKSLFQIKNYPSNLTGCDGADKYKVFLIERSTMMPKTAEGKAHRLSCTVLLMDKETNMPAFFLMAYITTNGVGNVTIYEQNENGTVYQKTVRWNSERDQQDQSE